MAKRPNTSGRVGAGEAPALPDAHGTWGAIARHRRDVEPKCAECRAFSTAYSREWYRIARAIPVFRERHNALTGASHRRQLATKRGRAADNAKRRARARAAKERARRDALHLVDEVVVRRVLSGQPASLNRPERLEAVRQLRARGASYPQIAQRLHVAERQVHRDLTDLGLIDPAGEVA